VGNPISSILNGDENSFFFSPRETTARIPRYARINTLKWTVDGAMKTFQKSGYTVGDPLDGMYVPLLSLSIEVFFIDEGLSPQELRTGRARREPSVVSPAVATDRYSRVF